MKKSIDLLLIKLKAKMSGKIKSFYTGDPFLIPESLMPCVIVGPNRTETDILDNQRDSHTHFIDISLVIDARKYFNATPEKMVGTDFLMETMEAEDTNGNIETSSILGILRDNMTLGSNRNIKNISSIDYTVRRRSEELITLEVSAHIEIEYLVSRNG